MDSPSQLKNRVFLVNIKKEKEQRQEQENGKKKKTGTKMEHYFSSDLSNLLTN